MLQFQTYIKKIYIIVKINQKNNIHNSVYDEEWIASAWGQTTSDFIENPTQNIRPRVNRAIDIAELSPGMNILDVGCGRGEVVFHCAGLGCHATGIDFSKPILKIAEEAQGNVSSIIRKNTIFIQGDVNKVHFPEKNFDRIFMLDLVEHLYDHQLVELYKTVGKLLKDDGLLIIHTLPNKWIYNVYSFVRFFLPWLDKDPRSDYEKKIHVNEQSCVTIKKLLSSCCIHCAVRIEEGFLEQAAWYKNKSFGDKRDKIYSFLRNPIVRFIIKIISHTPLRLIVLNDIYAVGAKSANVLKGIKFKNGLYEKFTLYISKN